MSYMSIMQTGVFETEDIELAGAICLVNNVHGVPLSGLTDNLLKPLKPDGTV